MGDEVKRYTSALNMALDKWQEQTEKDLAKDLAPVIKDLEKLDKNKDTSPDDKKQKTDLLTQARRMIDKRMGTSLTAFNATVKKVKKPEDLGDKQADILEDQLKDISDDYKKLKLPDVLTDKLTGLKDIEIRANVDDKGIIVGKQWTFGK